MPPVARAARSQPARSRDRSGRALPPRRLFSPRSPARAAFPTSLRPVRLRRPDCTLSQRARKRAVDRSVTQSIATLVGARAPGEPTVLPVARTTTFDRFHRTRLFAPRSAVGGGRRPRTTGPPSPRRRAGYSRRARRLESTKAGRRFALQGRGGGHRTLAGPPLPVKAQRTRGPGAARALVSLAIVCNEFEYGSSRHRGLLAGAWCVKKRGM